MVSGTGLPGTRLVQPKKKDNLSIFLNPSKGGRRTSLAHQDRSLLAMMGPCTDQI